MDPFQQPQPVLPPPRRRLSKKRKLFFAFGCIVALLVVLEGALRVRAWVKYGSSAAGVMDSMEVYDEGVGLRVPRPGYEVNAQKISIKINSLGFRGDEITVEKPPRTVRIACLGASTTFCADVSGNQATWPHELQEGLQKRYPSVKIEVINAAVPGYIASQSLINLQRRVMPLKPDLVIYYEANNDLAHDTRKLAQERGLIAPGESYRSAPVRFLSEWSLLFDLAHKNAKILLSQSDDKAGRLDGLPKDLPNRFIAELDKIHDELKQRNIPLVMSTFLVKYRRGQERSDQIANANVAFYYMPWMTIDDLLTGMDSYNEAIIEYARSHGVPVVEDRDSIPADAQHYVDWAHMTDAGCTKMAERFLWFFDENKIIDKLVKKTG